MSASDIQQQIVSTAPSYGIDPTLALNVAHAESAFNPSAVSSAGAIGVFQLMPATAAGLGVNPYDATQNINGGLSYLSSLISEFGNTSQALAAYNWGPGNVSNAIANYGDDWFDHLPTVTQNYVSGILGSSPDSSATSVPDGLIPDAGFLADVDGDDSASSDWVMYGAIAAAGVLAITLFSGK